MFLGCQVSPVALFVPPSITSPPFFGLFPLTSDIPRNWILSLSSSSVSMEARQSNHFRWRLGQSFDLWSPLWCLKTKTAPATTILPAPLSSSVVSSPLLPPLIQFFRSRALPAGTHSHSQFPNPNNLHPGRRPLELCLSFRVDRDQAEQAVLAGDALSRKASPFCSYFLLYSRCRRAAAS